MIDAKEFFEATEPRNDNTIIAGQRVSKKRCIELMKQYAQQQNEEMSDEHTLSGVEYRNDISDILLKHDIELSLNVISDIAQYVALAYAAGLANK